jgi:hypothetical protein
MRSKCPSVAGRGGGINWLSEDPVSVAGVGIMRFGPKYKPKYKPLSAGDFQEKLLNNGDKWEAEIAANIEADYLYR